MTEENERWNENSPSKGNRFLALKSFNNNKKQYRII